MSEERGRRGGHPVDQERFLKVGMNDYIPKPVRIEELNKVLGRVAGKPGSEPMQ